MSYTSQTHKGANTTQSLNRQQKYL